jgi:hypothetical protein
MTCIKRAMLAACYTAALAALSCPAALAAGRHPWNAVAQVREGERVAVYRAQQRYPQACDFVSADDSEVTCTPVDATDGQRLVFPRAAIREIDSFQTAPDRHIGIWIAAGITVGLVTAMCVANPLVGMLMGVTALGVWTDEASRPPLLPQRSGPHIRRHVVYRAPISATP